MKNTIKDFAEYLDTLGLPEKEFYVAYGIIASYDDWDKDISEVPSFLYSFLDEGNIDYTSYFFVIGLIKRFYEDMED